MFDDTAREAARGVCLSIALSSCSFGLLVSSSAIPQQRQIPAAGTASLQQQPQIQHYAAAAAAFPQQTVKVPELIKHNLKDAESVLRASKLLMGQPEFVASNDPPGTVVRQYPQADSVIRIGTTVLVWASAERPKQPQTQQPASGPQRDYMTVPNLVRFSESEARAILSKNGFSLGAVTQIPSSDQKPGLVIDQEPHAGSQAPRGSSVSISLAILNLVTVPSLIRHREDDAIRILQLVGLRVNTAGIQEKSSEEETGIVLSQDPSAGTQVGRESYVDFAVSRQIERKLVLRAFPTNIAPGESVTLTAELDPPFPGAEYQFSFGTGSPSAWSTNAQVQFTYLNDGNYEAVAAARWNNGGINSNPVRIVIHAVKYEVRLLPDALQVKSGETVSFRAEVRPAVESAIYIYHFGNAIPDQTSSLATAQYSYKSGGNYRAWVTVRIADAPAGAGTIHSHDFPSSPVQLSVEPQLQPKPPVVLYLIGAFVLIAVVSYAIWKIKPWGHRPPGLEILVHKDLGVQRLEVASYTPKGTEVEIHVVRSWGEQTIKSQGPLWARIERIHE